jgi:hypothetical protein
VYCWNFRRTPSQKGGGQAALTFPHLETISPEPRALLDRVGETDLGRRFYLAGGTALALQLGHRRSVDLDFFSETDFVHDHTRREILNALPGQEIEVVENVDGKLLLLAKDIHLGFFSYGYPLLAPLLEFERVRLATILDIGLMKLDALLGRGARKDFYDLYFICCQIPLADLLEAGTRKYPQMRDFPLMAVESLVAFDNANRDRQPDLLVDVAWGAVRDFFLEQAKQMGKHWFKI